MDRDGLRQLGVLGAKFGHFCRKGNRVRLDVEGPQTRGIGFDAARQLHARAIAFSSCCFGLPQGGQEVLGLGASDAAVLHIVPGARSSETRSGEIEDKHLQQQERAGAGAPE